MASKRKLKKDIVKLVKNLFDEAMLLRVVSTEETVAKLGEFIDDIIVFADDTIRRAQNPDAKANPKLVKAYYQKLRQDIAQKEQEYNQKLYALALEP